MGLERGDSHRLESEASDPRLRCPKDGTLMERQTVGAKGGSPGVTIDRCARCGALWLDANEMEQIFALHAAKSVDLGPFGADNKPNGPIAPLHCPRDHSLLVEIADKQQKHVLIMLCTECGGKLLDAGELIDLSEFTMMERLRAALKLG